MVFRPNVDSKLCFVLMPFSENHNDYFRAILVPAADSVGLRATKADQIYGTGAIIQDIWQSIWSAQVVVADVTGRNPNVNYELGLCHALGIPTILISQDISDVPFDYRHRRCILYKTSAIDWQKKLENDIRETIITVLAGNSGREELEWPYDTSAIKFMETAGPFVRSETAREPMLRGIDQAYEAMAMAFGPHGKSVLTSSRAFAGRPSRSGIAIATALSSADPLVQLGLDRVRELTRETSAELGDGTKSAAMLFCEMVKGGYESLQNGAVLRELITEMDLAVEAAVDYLRKASKGIDRQRFRGVASTAALGDQLDGHTVVSALESAGPDGVVLVEDSPDLSTNLLISEGMHFNQGFISSRFITDEPRQLAILTNAHVALCSFKLSGLPQIMPLLEQVARAEHSLLLVASDVEGEALETLEVNHERAILHSVAVKAPGQAASRDLILGDIAVATGGAVFSHPTMLQSSNLDRLGFAEFIEVSRNNTWLTRPRGDKKLVDSRAAGIRQQISVAGAAYEAERLRERLASLVGATVVIRAGGVSEVDRSERKVRIEASLRSTRAALSDGILLGGGNSLWRARQHLIRADMSLGAKVISQSLGSPLSAQIRNSRLSFSEITRQMDESPPGEVGFDASKRELGDLNAAQIFDATSIVIRGLQIAFSHARNLLQTGAWEVPPLVTGLGAP